MKKLFLFQLLFMLTLAPAFAEKIPVRLENTAMISTHKDEVELGDLVPFKVVNDVYLNNKIYIKKDTKVVGFVDFVQENGWAGSGAEIKFKKFVTKNVQNEVVTINYPITLDGNAERFAATTNYATTQSPLYLSFMGTISSAFMLVRGHELEIKPQKAVFSVFIER